MASVESPAGERIAADADAAGVAVGAAATKVDSTGETDTTGETEAKADAAVEADGTAEVEDAAAEGEATFDTAAGSEVGVVAGTEGEAAEAALKALPGSFCSEEVDPCVCALASTTR